MATVKKDTILLHLSHWASINSLSDASLGKLFRALYHEQLVLEPIDLSNDGMVSMAFSFIHNQIQIDAQKYEETRKLRSEAGQKSGLARRNNKQNEQTNITHSNAEQNEQLFPISTRSNKENHNNNE